MSSWGQLIKDKLSICLSDMNHLASMKIILPSPLVTDIGLAQAPWLLGVLWSLTSPSTEWTSRTRDLTSAGDHFAYIHELVDYYCFTSPSTSKIGWPWKSTFMGLILHYVTYSRGLFSKCHLSILSPISAGYLFIHSYPMISPWSSSTTLHSLTIKRPLPPS